MSSAKARRASGSLPELRDDLARAAAVMIARDGLEAFSLRGVAREVAIDPAMVYRCYDSRADLIAAVVRTGFAEMARSMESRADAVPSSSSDPLRDRFFALGRAYIEFAAEQPGHFRAMFGPNGLGAIRPEIRGVGATGRSPLELLTSLLAEIEQAGRLALPLDRAALACWTMAHGAAELLVAGALAGSSSPIKEREPVVAGVLASLNELVFVDPR